MDRLTKQARQKAEKQSERQAFNNATAMTEALQRALAARQNSASTTTNEAHHGQHTAAGTP